MAWEVELYMPCTELDNWLTYFRFKRSEEEKAYKKQKAETDRKQRRTFGGRRR